MARPIQPKPDYYGYDAPYFDITCVVGTVDLGRGDTNPYEAALAIIGRHGAPGTFRFPLQGGSEATVEITLTNPDEAVYFTHPEETV